MGVFEKDDGAVGVLTYLDPLGYDVCGISLIHDSP